MADVHRESKMQEARNTTANQPVNLFKTSAVDVPKRESLVSPPNEAPSPEDLLSCIKITKHNTAQRIMKRIKEII